MYFSGAINMAEAKNYAFVLIVGVSFSTEVTMWILTLVLTEIFSFVEMLANCS